jgi:VWFA-related protein
VRVLDAAGRPVAGLNKEDFRLTDNGKTQKITEFEVHTNDRPAIRHDKELGSALSKPGDIHRRFFLLFDIQRSDEVGLANAKKAALHFVETQLLPSDEVGVLSFAPMTGLSLKEYLTSDLGKIKKAIARAKEVPPSPGFIGGVEVMEDQKEAMRQAQEKQAARLQEGEVIGQQMDDSLKDPFNLVNVPSLKLYARSDKDFNASLAAIASVLNAIPRPLHVIFFSARSIPVSLARSFATANIPVFVVQTQNWKMETFTETPFKKKYIWEEHPLRDFALATGGQYFADIEKLKGIAEGIQSFSNEYYILGYYVHESWNGQYHKIRVTVDRPGCQVFAQAGYSEPRPFGQWSEIEKKIQLYEMIYGDEPTLKRFETLAVDVLHIPGSEGRVYLLAGVPCREKNGLAPGPTELHTVVFDEQGEIEASAQSKPDFTGQGEHTKYIYISTALPAGEHEFRLIARNMMTGESAVGRTVFKAEGPMKEVSEGLRLSTPLLYVPGSNAEYLNMSAPAKKGAKPPSIGDYYPIVPKEFVPLIGSLPRGVKTCIAVFPVEKTLNPILELHVKAEICSSDGAGAILLEHRFLDLKSVHPTRNAYVYEVSLPELAPGAYELKITVWEKEDGPRSAIRKMLKVFDK